MYKNMIVICYSSVLLSHSWVGMICLTYKAGNYFNCFLFLQPFVYYLGSGRHNMNKPVIDLMKVSKKEKKQLFLSFFIMEGVVVGWGGVDLF